MRNAAVKKAAEKTAGAAEKTYGLIFDGRGSAYDEAMRRFPHARKNEFENILKLAELKDGDVVCDFPAGGGYSGRYIPQNVRLSLLETSQVFYELCIRNGGGKGQAVLTEENIIPFDGGS